MGTSFSHLFQNPTSLVCLVLTRGRHKQLGKRECHEGPPDTAFLVILSVDILLPLFRGSEPAWVCLALGQETMGGLGDPGTPFLTRDAQAWTYLSGNLLSWELPLKCP